jgi:hypothetical protein
LGEEEGFLDFEKEVWDFGGIFWKHEHLDVIWRHEACEI